MLASALAADAARAQVPADSLREYALSEIVVGGAVSGSPGAYAARGLRRVDEAALSQAAPLAASDAMRLVPGAHVQTNSRGETLVYLRAAGERQVGLFLDGALLNVPWDNRFDLSLLPASVLGEVTAAVGVPAVTYGANVLGGAINVQTRSRSSQGRGADLAVSLGTRGLQQGEATYFSTGVRWRSVVHAGWLEQAAAALPGRADVPFSQASGSRRTNTDRRVASALVRTEWAGERSALALTLLGLDAEKGVAPESHLDPARERVRFWRYPTWRYGTAILSARRSWSGSTNFDLRGSLWLSAFEQDIEQYASAAYADVRETQADHDLTAGGRAVASAQRGAHALDLAASGYASRHRQTDAERGVLGALRLTYAQRVGSVGAVYRFAPNSRLREFALGASLDGAAYPRAGDKPARAATWTPGFDASVRVALGARAEVTARVGRKARFPTPRELFGVALGEFLLNPDLAPESAVIAELGLHVRGERVAYRVITFARRTTDTIAQRTLRIDGQRFRQRINLGSSRTLGVEVGASGRPWLGARLDAHVTAQHARGREEDGAWQRLAEKPDLLATLSLTQNLLRWQAGGEARALGRAFSPDADGVLRPLPRSLAMSAFVARRFRVGRAFVRAEARADNLFDATVVPQRGLPAPGRALRLRVTASL